MALSIYINKDITEKDNLVDLIKDSIHSDDEFEVSYDKNSIRRTPVDPDGRNTAADVYLRSGDISLDATVFYRRPDLTLVPVGELNAAEDHPVFIYHGDVEHIFETDLIPEFVRPLISNRLNIPKDSFIDTVVGNLTNGRPAVFNWSWENGRVFQTLSLFMLGMLAGRKGLFKESDSNIRFWKKALVISLVAFIPLFQAKTNVGTWYTSEALIRPLSVILSSWANLAFMIFLVSSFVLLYRTSLFNKALNLLKYFWA